MPERKRDELTILFFFKIRRYFYKNQNISRNRTLNVSMLRHNGPAIPLATDDFFDIVPNAPVAEKPCQFAEKYSSFGYNISI